MKKMTKVILGATVLPILLSTSAVMAKGGDNDGHRGQCKGGSEKSLLKKLDLTTEQKVKLEELREASKEARQAERKAIKAQEQQLVMAAEFDESAALELAKKMVDDQAGKRVEKLKSRFDMMSVLTPEQKAKFTELQQEKMGNCDMDGEKRGHKNKKGSK